MKKRAKGADIWNLPIYKQKTFAYNLVESMCQSQTSITKVCAAVSKATKGGVGRTITKRFIGDLKELQYVEIDDNGKIKPNGHIKK